MRLEKLEMSDGNRANPFDLAERVDRTAMTTHTANAPVWDRDCVYPGHAIEALAGMGVLGATLDRKHGGCNATIRQVLEVVRLVSLYSGVLGRVVVDANLGPTLMLKELADEDLLHEVAASIGKGNKPAIAITEPEAGSAASDMRSAVTSRNMPAGRYLLNGKKAWITGAPRSTHYVTFARFAHAGPGAKGIGIVVVRADRRGFSSQTPPRMMGMRAVPEGSITFTNYELSEQDVLARPPDGFRDGMSLYNSQRLGAAMVAAAIAEKALVASVDYCKARHQGGIPLDRHQGVRWKLAEMAVKVEHTMSFIRAVADDAGRSSYVDKTRVAMAKLQAAEMALEVTSTAVQLHGARGYDTATGMEQLYRDARMFTIGGGTTEILRDVIGGELVEHGYTNDPRKSRCYAS